MSSIYRREFLSRSSQVIGMTLLAGTDSASADSDRPVGLKKSLKYGMVRQGNSLLEKFRLVKSIGFDAIELSSPNNLDLDEVLRVRDRTDLPIHGVVDSRHWKYRLSDPDPSIQVKGLEALRTAIDDAVAYGATTVLLVPGRVTRDATYEQCWQRSGANIRKMLPYAEKQGIKIGIENVWNDFLTDPKEMARYLDEFESPWIGAYFDIGNTLRYSPPEQWIPVLGKRILKLDIKAYGHQKKFDYLLGEGDVDWKAVRRQITKIGYQGYCTAEMKGGDAEYLQDLCQRMDRVLGIGS